MSEEIYPPQDRYCDLIMKGGITSGIVYPKAIHRLAQRYRFRSIGGTSAGAMAAALTAAAELNRRQHDSLAGFDMLATLPDELKETMPDTGRSRLLGLFQAQAGTRRLMATLIHTLNSQGAWHRVGAVIAGLLWAYLPAALASLVGAGVVARYIGWTAGVLALLFGLLASIGIWVYYDITCRVVKNGFGLCSGMGGDSARPALTPWLHAHIQRTAGLTPADPPLTFGQLWRAPGFPPSWLKVAHPAATRSIDLQMFSTNLGHGRPYIFPLSGADDATAHPARERLYFNPEELKHYLPDDVLAWLKANGVAYQCAPNRTESDPDETEAAVLNLLELPPAEHFPVVLAARMSLSFPFLLSAIPLWSIDSDAGRPGAHFRRCWFSDGGISSNFPIHLFDNLLPLWPTFGINLQDAPDDAPAAVASDAQSPGPQERWERFDEAKASVSRLGGFIVSIVHAMQNWNDNAMARMPGVRDRIAEVYLKPNEGGMNLDMDGDTINALCQRGVDAIIDVLRRFDSPDPVLAPATGWDAQRFARLGILVKAIEGRMPGLAQALDALVPYATHFEDLITAAARAPQDGGWTSAPPGYPAALTAQQAEDLRHALQLLRACAASSGGAAGAAWRTASAYLPQPELRVRPPI